MDAVTRALEDKNSAATRKEYASEWHRFTTYCELNGLSPLPASPKTVYDYLTSQTSPDAATGLPERAFSAVARSVTVIAYIHQATDTPVVNPEAGTIEYLWRSPELNRHLAQLQKRYNDTPRKARPPTRRLSGHQLQTVIRRARLDALTWEDRYFERRDSALLYAVGHSHARRSDIEQFTTADLRQRDDRRWTITSYWIRKYPMPIVVTATAKVHVCAPCAWIRWMEVLSTHAVHGTDGLQRLLSADDSVTTHACKIAGADQMVSPPTQPLFPKGDPAKLQPRPLTGAAAHAILKKRLSQSRVNHDASAIYGLDGLSHTIANIAEKQPLRRYCQDLWMRLFQAASCWSGEAVPGSTSSPFLKVAPART